MKEFIQRNSPVFVVGAITLIIFLIITVISTAKEQYIPDLIRLTEEQSEKQEYLEIQPEVTIDEINEATISSLTEQYEVFDIEFTEDGFVPQNEQVYQFQTVRWTNKTNRYITIEQISNTYGDFQPIEIAAGDSKTFTVTKLKLWVYRESITDEYGSLFVFSKE